MAETGDADAERTVVFIAHHDAAHSGLVFHPVLPRIPLKLAPRLHARAGRSFPLMYTVWLGPVLVCAGSILGARRVLAAGTAIAAGATAAMADIGARASVPGANDNLSAVGVVIALAARLRERPVEGVRVLLISTGSEESFSEGMQGFGRRHFGELDRGPHRDGLPRVPRRPDADRRRGRGDAPDARLPDPHARGARRRRRGHRPGDRSRSAHNRRHRRDHPAPRRLRRRDARVGRRDQAPDELPLAERCPGRAALEHDRERDRGLRGVRAPARGKAKAPPSGAADHPPNRAPLPLATATPPGRAARARRRRRRSPRAGGRRRAPASRPGCSRSSAAPPRERRPRSRRPV